MGKGDITVTHKDIFKAFKDVTQMSDERVRIWYPNGRHSIRVALVGGRELIFTYDSPNYWRLETRGAFLTNMK